MEIAQLNLFVLLVSYIVGISFFSYVTASISNFLDENLEEGKIFDFYGKWLRKEVWHNKSIEEREDYLKSCCQFSAENISIVYNPNSSEVRYGSEEKLKVPKWKKPLGACVYCMNTWVTWIAYSLITIAVALFFSRVIHWDVNGWFQFWVWFINTIVSCALSNTFLGKINR